MWHSMLDTTNEKYVKVKLHKIYVGWRNTLHNYTIQNVDTMNECINVRYIEHQIFEYS